MGGKQAPRPMKCMGSGPPARELLSTGARDNRLSPDLQPGTGRPLGHPRAGGLPWPHPEAGHSSGGSQFPRLEVSLPHLSTGRRCLRTAILEVKYNARNGNEKLRETKPLAGVGVSSGGFEGVSGLPIPSGGTGSTWGLRHTRSRPPKRYLCMSPALHPLGAQECPPALQALCEEEFTTQGDSS